MRILTLLMTLALAGAARGAVNEAIAFHGFLTNADGTGLGENTVVKIDFKLYPSANAGAELLWARRIPVTIDGSSGFYVDIMDTVGQSYQAAGGVTPSCSTLRDALVRHARLSPGPVWLAYEVADAKIATPMPRVPLYRQPLAQYASSARQTERATIGTLETTKLTAAAGTTVAAGRVVVNTDNLRLGGFILDVPERDVMLNPGGSVRIRSVTGLACSAATNLNGAAAADLPATADSDCGRVIRHVVGGAETLTALYYSKGNSTIVPAGATNVYVWSFGPLVTNSQNTVSVQE